jgi:hypothetical protein
MITRKLAAAAALLLLQPLGWADASYQSTTQMTGGTLVNTIRISPFAPKEAKSVLEPDTTLTVVHGNQKAMISKDHTEIYDIDKESITRINNEKKTYTITTFAQLRQIMKDMGQKVESFQSRGSQGQPAVTLKTSFDTQVKNPGVSKLVNGLLAEERIITLTTKVTDANPNDPPMSITYVTTTELWFAPEPPEMHEINDFDVRMYTKMAQGLDMPALTKQMTAGGGMRMMLGNQPGASEAMAAMDKEIAKVKGIRVLEITTMSGTGFPIPPGAPASAPAAAPAAPAPAAASGGSVIGQVANDTATQTAAGESSKLGVFGSALSSSALGAFRRKKATQPPAAAAPVPAAAPALTAAPSGSAPAGDPNTLMTTTRQMTNFSREPVPASAFLIPTGYKQVQSPNGMF